MRCLFCVSILLIVSLLSCKEKSVSLIGTWQADKFNISVDESVSTPELVRETGLIEKQNRIVVAADSVLLLTNGNDTLFEGRCCTASDGVFASGKDLSIRWDGKNIITEEHTPFGVITIGYEKR